VAKQRTQKLLIDSTNNSAAVKDNMNLVVALNPSLKGLPVFAELRLQLKQTLHL